MASRTAVLPYESLDGLLEALLEELEPRLDTPQPTPIVVPSLPFSDWLQLRISERRGVCMGIDFLMPQDFIRRAVEFDSPASEDPWSKRQLIWRILPHIATYAASLGVTDASSRDRLALAELIADRFDQYGHFRPHIVRRWAAGQPALRAEADNQIHEQWQRELWRKLQAEIDAPHPALELERMKADPKFHRALRAAFPKLIVLGTGAIDPLLVEVLGVAAEAGCEVRMHVVFPSLGFLGDLRRQTGLPSDDQDPESIEVTGGHPLVQSMGRHAVGSFLLLGELDDEYTHWPEPRAGSHRAASLLGRLQSDIRELRVPAPLPANREDLSLRVHSCFGPRREMETLRDEILRAFQDLEDLKPEEVHIVVSSLETYAPLVSAIFEQGGIPLPVRMTELPPSNRDPLIQGWLALLEIAHGGRFQASELIELLHLPTVQESLEIAGDIDALERIRQWIERSGLTHSLGDDDENPGTWLFARERLVAGRWFGPEETVAYPSGDFVLPVADELTGDADLRERFIAWQSRLAKTLRAWRQEAAPREWSERLALVCGEILSGEEDAWLSAQPYVSFLGGLDCPEKIDAGALLDWLEAESAESGRRTVVSGKMTLGRFKQLQNLPCRVLAMAGMQDANFPGQHRVPAWDLLQLRPRVWDRNARIDDRQLFLDAVLTPSERLIVTGSTRNVRTCKTEPFSSCVDELLRVAVQMGRSRKNLVVDHRLQPFDAGYFDTADPARRSFDVEQSEVARLFQSPGRDSGIPFWNGTAADSPPVEDTVEISIDQLAGFWRDPGKAFLRAQGIPAPRDEQDDLALDRPPLSLDGLQAWTIKNAVVEEILLGDSRLDLAQARLAANRGLPPGNLGRQAWETNRTLSEPLGASVKERLGENIPVDFVFDPARVRITGTLLTGTSERTLLAYRIGEMKESRHFLAAWIQGVVASAAGHTLPTFIFDEKNPTEARPLPAIAPERAAAILAELIEGFLERQRRPLCFAPAASDAYAKFRNKNKSESESLDAARQSWNRKGFNSQPAGEGFSAAATIAWRDRDPFEDADSWHRWAEAVAIPLSQWTASP